MNYIWYTIYWSNTCNTIYSSTTINYILIQYIGPQATIFYMYTYIWVLIRLHTVYTDSSSRPFLVCWRMLTYADARWRMLTYADVCWRMLTHADSGSRPFLARPRRLIWGEACVWVGGWVGGWWWCGVCAAAASGGASSSSRRKASCTCSSRPHTLAA